MIRHGKKDQEEVSQTPSAAGRTRRRAVMYAADLTEAYFEYNKGDVTDSTPLGE